jgi:hypothetical protein
MPLLRHLELDLETFCEGKDIMNSISSMLRLARDGTPLLRRFDYCDYNETYQTERTMGLCSRDLFGHLLGNMLPEIEYLRFFACVSGYPLWSPQEDVHSLSSSSSSSPRKNPPPSFVFGVLPRMKTLMLSVTFPYEGSVLVITDAINDSVEDFILCVSHCFPNLEHLRLSFHSDTKGHHPRDVHFPRLGTRAFDGGRFRSLKTLHLAGLQIFAEDVAELDLSKMEKLTLNKMGVSQETVEALKFRKPELDIEIKGSSSRYYL